MNEPVLHKQSQFFGTRFDGPRDSPGFRLWTLHQRWQRTLNAVLSPHGLTQPQFSILAVAAWLARYEAEVTQADICRFAALERMQVSQICRKLERMGFLERNASTSDVRAVALSLTKDGGDKLTAVLPIVEQADEVFFAKDEQI